MPNPNNTIILRGGLTRDAELNEKIDLVEMSLAIDGAGSVKGESFPAGYFDLKVWLKGSDYTPVATAKQVRKAYDDGQLRKGTRIAIVGQLRHERWEKDGKKDSKVTIVVDSIDIFTPQAKTGNIQNQQVGAASSTNDDDEPSFVPNF